MTLPELVVSAPRLTALDRRVLASLPAADEPGKRMAATFLAPASTPRCSWHGRQYGNGETGGCERCAAAIEYIAAAYDEHCEILRGLERCYAICRGGWWRRV